MKPQAELIRFARDENGEWRLDRQKRAGGRGVWVCFDRRCHERKALGRAFRAQAPQVAAQLAALDELDQERTDAKESLKGGIDG